MTGPGDDDKTGKKGNRSPAKPAGFQLSMQLTSLLHHEEGYEGYFPSEHIADSELFSSKPYSPSDKDFPTKQEANVAALSSYKMLSRSMRALEKELDDTGAPNRTGFLKKIKDAANGEKSVFISGVQGVDPHLIQHGVGFFVSYVGGTMLSSAMRAPIAPSPSMVWLSIIPAAASVAPIANYTVSADVKNSIRDDFRGKQESSFVYQLDKENNLFIPVTPQNILVLSQAADAATRYVREAKESGQLEGLAEGIRQTMLDYIVEHGEKISKERYYQFRPVQPTEKFSYAPASETDTPSSGLPKTPKTTTRTGP